MSERPTPETDAFFRTFADGEAAPSHAEYYDRMAKLERERNAERALADRLAEAANEVIAQWQTPNWKLTESTATYMNTLRNTLTAWKEARND